MSTVFYLKPCIIILEKPVNPFIREESEIPFCCCGHSDKVPDVYGSVCGDGGAGARYVRMNDSTTVLLTPNR